MFGQIFAIARNTFLESVRQPIFFVLLIAGWLLQVFNTLLSGYSMAYSDSAEVSGDDKLLLDIGLATVFVIATLLAAFVATAVLTREIENKTALTVISKPVGRPVFIFGKYLGVTAAIVLATIVMLVFFQFAIRHGVMSTARDNPDLPVILFSLLAIFSAVAVGVWGNFFYGWVFSSVAVFVLLPVTLIAWGATMIISPDWSFQAPTADLKPQVLLASAAVLLSMPVLTAIAITASTRLGQVMTIVVAFGAFMLGLLSNHFLGTIAFQNSYTARVELAEIDRDLDGDLSDAGDTWFINFEVPPDDEVNPGDSIYYGPTPDGIAVPVPPHPTYEGTDVSERAAAAWDGAPALVFHSLVDESLNRHRIINMGGLEIGRPPREGDYVFLRPTEINIAAVGAWSIVPNLQFYWLVDAVTQNHRIPARYIAMVGLYTLVQITGLLALSVILFQRREVG